MVAEEILSRLVADFIKEYVGRHRADLPDLPRQELESMVQGIINEWLLYRWGGG